MTEADILDAIEGQGRRNAALLSRLKELAVDLDCERAIDVNLWAPDRESAAVLARQLYDKGYLVTALTPSGGRRVGDEWSVEAQVSASPTVAASRGRTEELVRLAAAAGGVYDGWGTEAD